MEQYRLALIGFGNVGQGFARLLRERGSELTQQLGRGVQIVAVSDVLKGSVYDPAGLVPAALLAAMQAAGNLEGVPAPFRGWDALRTIRESNANVIVELSYTDLVTGEPAFTHLRSALATGKHVITTNKGPIALHYDELRALAVAHGVEIGVEGTVMSGTPVMRLGHELLAAGIRRIEGIVNGTTNYILTLMEEGATYETALAEAQARGYAEADPAGDVEGYDAAAKMVILARVLMNAQLSLANVDRCSITELTPRDIRRARREERVWKLVGSLEHGQHGVTARVGPVSLPLTHPLASVRGATNALTFTTDLLGEVTLLGPGAGRLETAYAIVCDLLAIERQRCGSAFPPLLHTED